MTRVIVTGPQYNRPASWPTPGEAPKTLEEWEALRDVPMQELCAEHSFINWDGRMALIPGEWFGSLPVGLVLHCVDDTDRIVGSARLFSDTRYGCLAYGLLLRENK